MRIKDRKIRAVAPVIRPYLWGVITTKGSISNQDIKDAIKEAIEDGHKLPRLVSDRSLGMVESELVEM